MKHFTQDGNLYKKKAQITVNIILVVGLLVIAYAGYYAKAPAMMWVFLGLAVFSFLGTITQRLVIDLDNRVISGKMALLKPSFRIPIDNIQNFELYSLSQNFIRTNTALNLYYINDKGKEKVTSIAQAFSMKPIQNILNEIEEILEKDGANR